VERERDMPRASEEGSRVELAGMGGRFGEGQAEEAVEREGESSRAWHASEQYIRLWKDVMRLDKGDHVREIVQGLIITCRQTWVCRIGDSSPRRTLFERESKVDGGRERRKGTEGFK